MKFFEFTKKLHDIIISFFRVLTFGYIKYGYSYLFNKGEKNSVYNGLPRDEYKNLFDSYCVIKKDKENLTYFPFLVFIFYIIIKFSIIDIIKFLIS